MSPVGRCTRTWILLPALPGVRHASAQTAIDAAYNFLQEQKTDVKPDRNAQSAITWLVVHNPEGNEVEMVPE